MIRQTNSWILPENKKKAVEHESDGDSNCSRPAANGLQSQRRRQEELEIRGRIETIQIIILLK